MIGSGAGIHEDTADGEPEALIESSLNTMLCPYAFEELMTREIPWPPASEGP